MIKFEYKWMRLALLQAKLAKKEYEIPIGAVLVNIKNNKIIAKSRNKVFSTSNPLAHAEIEVISKAVNICGNRYLEDTAIYVTLEPCLMCAAAITEARISKVYFGAYDEKKGAFENGARLLKHKFYFKPEVYGGIMEEECSKLIKNFFKKIRNK